METLVPTFSSMAEQMPWISRLEPHRRHHKGRKEITGLRFDMAYTVHDEARDRSLRTLKHGSPARRP
jgi:hypothetical protein